MKKNIIPLLIMCVASLLSSCVGGGKKADYSLIPVHMGNNYGYIDQSGEMVINPQFATASFFNDDLAVVYNDSKYGYINKKGEYQIPLIYKRVTQFNDGLAWVVKEGGAPAVINKKGEELFSLKDAEVACAFSEGMACYAIGNAEHGELKCGYVDTKGEIVIVPSFVGADPFSEGLASVMNDESKYGYIDLKGDLVINHQFDRAGEFENGRAVVKLNDKYGVIDKKGKLIINPQFDRMETDGDMYRVRMNDKWGWCDSKGKFLINPQFDEVDLFSNNTLAPVRVGGQFGYIDKKGKITINPQFTRAESFLGNLAEVAIGRGEDAKVGFIDKDGKYVVNPQFSFAHTSSYDYVKSDYFNVEVIVSTIQGMLSNNAVDGINFSTKLSEIMSKYSIKESQLTKSGNIYLLKKLNPSPDAAIFLKMKADIYDKVSDGWWGYKHVLKDNATANELGCVIDLEGKGEGKEQMLVEALKKALNLNEKGEGKLGELYIYVTIEFDDVVIVINPQYVARVSDDEFNPDEMEFNGDID